MDINRDFATKWITENESRFKIQYMPEELRAEIEIKHTKNKKLDEVEYMKEILNHCLQDWLDVKANGKILKCDVKNKAALAISVNHPGLALKLILTALLPQTFHPDMVDIIKNSIGQSSTSDNGKKEEVTEVA